MESFAFEIPRYTVPENDINVQDLNEVNLSTVPIEQQVIIPFLLSDDLAKKLEEFERNAKFYKGKRDVLE